MRPSRSAGSPGRLSRRSPRGSPHSGSSCPEEHGLPRRDDLQSGEAQIAQDLSVPGGIDELHGAGRACREACGIECPRDLDGSTGGGQTAHRQVAFHHQGPAAHRDGPRPGHVSLDRQRVTVQVQRGVVRQREVPCHRDIRRQVRGDPVNGEIAVVKRAELTNGRVRRPVDDHPGGGIHHGNGIDARAAEVYRSLVFQAVRIEDRQAVPAQIDAAPGLDGEPLDRDIEHAQTPSAVN